MHKREATTAFALKLAHTCFPRTSVLFADFIRAHDPDGTAWPDYRIQRAWDGIALHAEPMIALYKEPDTFAI